MAMNRYLIHISYIGTHFKAFTKASLNGKVVVPTTVGVIEDALRGLKPKNPINVRTISRTDAGVHALNSAVVVDLQRANNKTYDVNYIVGVLNEYFEESQHAVRVNKAQLVPNTFNEHVNAVKSRTYLYRLGIIKKNKDIACRLEEKDRCFFIYSDDFNMERFKEAAQMFVGRHDFRSFMTVNNDVHRRASFATRTMNYVNIERGQALTVQPFDGEIDYWDVFFNAQSFLYRQIRRMVGALVAVAKGHINQRDLYEMLTIPSQNSSCNKIIVAPAYGLYLADIEFRERCLVEDILSRPK